MDFVTLAKASDDAIREITDRYLRRQMQQEEQDATDDDFTHLSGGGSSSHHHMDTTITGDSSLATATAINVADPIMSTSTTTAATAATARVADGGRPLLSPSAEAELFLLATNFLLYVAMVIIITMIAKIYFPESLTRGQRSQQNQQGGGSSAARKQQPQMARSVNYRRVEGEDDDDEEEDLDVDDDDVDDETEDLLGLEREQEEAEAGKKEDPPSSPASSASPSSSSSSSSLKKKKTSTKKTKSKSGVPLMTNRSRNNSWQDDLRNETFLAEGGEGSSSRGGRGGRNSDAAAAAAADASEKNVVMKRLMFCSIMLNLTFVTWGILQERMLTRRYPRYTGEYFTYSYALVFTNRFWTLLMSSLLLLYLKPRRSQSTVIYEYSFPSISNMLSSWCQYEALRYVSFPAATLMKCFKLAPVMAMGKILGNKEYPQYDYVVAVVIGCGIAMFMSSTDDLELGYDIHGTATFEKWTGIMMLGLYLFFDSFTGQWQSRMFQHHRDLSMVELLFATSAFSTALSLVTLIHTKELGRALEFVIRHQEIHLHFFLFSICSTIGQLTIFYTIKNFGAVVFTIIMTMRILLSIALSCILYGHPVTSTGFLGLMTVLGGVIYRVKRKAEGTQLIKWQGMGDEKAVELVQEWHEHLDM